MSTRAQIIAVARRLFASKGYAATATETVLQQSGVSRGALYHHFKSKEALFEAVLDELEQELAGAASEAAAQAADPVSALRAGCASFLIKSIDPEVRQIILVDAHSVLGWDKWRKIEERYGLGLLKQAFGALATAGHIPADKVDLYAHILLATMIEVAFVSSRSSNPSKTTRKALKTLDDLFGRLLPATRS